MLKQTNTYAYVKEYGENTVVAPLFFFSAIRAHCCYAIHECFRAMLRRLR